jgi:hypothetical protein
VRYSRVVTSSSERRNTSSAVSTSSSGVGRRTRVLGRVQREHLGGERVVAPAGRAEAARLHFGPIEQRRDPCQVVERAAAPRLRRVRRDHRHHERAVEQRAQVLLAKPGLDQLIDRRLDTIRRRAALRVQCAQPLPLLGDVHHVALERVRARGGLEVVLAEDLDLLREGASPAGELAAPECRGRIAEPPAQRLDAPAAERRHRAPQRRGQSCEIVA